MDRSSYHYTNRPASMLFTTPAWNEPRSRVVCLETPRRKDADGRWLPRELTYYAPPRLCIVGYGRAGKDTAGDWLAAHTPLVHPGATSIYLLPYYVARKHDLPLEDVKAGEHKGLCDLEYARRHELRMEWYDLGNVLRAEDPGILADAALAQGHILAGCRDACEIHAARSKGKVDLVLWVDNDRVPEDPTVKFGPEIADLRVENHGTLEAYHRKLEALCRFAGIPTYTT